MSARDVLLASSFSVAVPRLQTGSAHPIPMRLPSPLLLQQRQRGPIWIRAEASVNGSESWDWDSSKPLPPLPKLDIIPLANKLYYEECNKTLSELFHLDHRITYTYAAMCAYFRQTTVGLKGLSKFFKESSFRALGRAEALDIYKTASSEGVPPFPTELFRFGFDHPQKGHALNAMELALALEELRHEKLLKLRNLAERCSNPDLENLIDSEFLTEEETKIIKDISSYVVCLGIGGKEEAWLLDQIFLHGSTDPAR